MNLLFLNLRFGEFFQKLLTKQMSKKINNNMHDIIKTLNYAEKKYSFYRYN